MARYLVLSFDDNAQAETLVEDWWRAMQTLPKDEDDKVNVRLLTPIQENDVECTIVGLVGKPTQFCDPSDDHLKGRGKTGRGFTRGKKWGWWVCAICKRPTKGWAAGWKAVVGDGRNLLNDLLKELEDDKEEGG